jgi:hypothetical protein
MAKNTTEVRLVRKRGGKRAQWHISNPQCTCWIGADLTFTVQTTAIYDKSERAFLLPGMAFIDESDVCGLCRQSLKSMERADMERQRFKEPARL